MHGMHNVIVSLAVISMAFLLVNVVDSMAEKSDDVAEKAVEKAKEVVDKATGNNGNGNDDDDDDSGGKKKSKSKSKDKDDDDDDDSGGKKKSKSNDESNGNSNSNSNNESEKKDNANDKNDDNANDKNDDGNNSSEEKDSDNDKQGSDTKQSQAKSDDSKPKKKNKNKKITNNLQVRGTGVIYDLKKPIIQQILHTQDATCVQVSDDTGVDGVKAGSVSLELYPGSYNWYCAKGSISHIIVEDLAGNEVKQAQNEIHVDQPGAKSQPQPSNFRFKNMNSLFVKKVTVEDLSVADIPTATANSVNTHVVNDGHTDEPVKKELLSIRLKNMNSQLFKKMTAANIPVDYSPIKDLDKDLDDQILEDYQANESVNTTLFTIRFKNMNSSFFEKITAADVYGIDAIIIDLADLADLADEAVDDNELLRAKNINSWLVRQPL